VAILPVLFRETPRYEHGPHLPRLPKGRVAVV